MPDPTTPAPPADDRWREARKAVLEWAQYWAIHQSEELRIDAAALRLAVARSDALDAAVAAMRRANQLMSHLMPTVNWGSTFDLDIGLLNKVCCELPAVIAHCEAAQET